MDVYRAVSCRCAVDFEALALPISKEEAMAMLQKMGFRIIAIDLVALARSYIGVSEYRRGAKIREAPGIFDCSSLMKWLYGQRGIWLPRRSIQQWELGEPVPRENILAGDVVFVSGRIDYYIDDPRFGVGHVGIATDSGTVVHAANRTYGVTESPLGKFLGGDKFRGARRYVPRDRNVVTLETPAGREIESSDDVRWVILQSL